jgi:hypothetical protein
MGMQVRMKKVHSRSFNTLGAVDLGPRTSELSTIDDDRDHGDREWRQACTNVRLSSVDATRVSEQ